MAAGVPVAARVVPVHDGRRGMLAFGAVLGVAALAITVGAALGAEAPTLTVVARACMVGVPVAVGLYASYRRLNERFGLLLVAAGAGWFLTTLAESSDAVLYTVGRAAGWLGEVLLIYLFLSFPSGRLS